MAEHLSGRHDFRANDQATYPRVTISLQLRFVNGFIGDLTLTHLTAHAVPRILETSPAL
jgi:hypothetical protein